jgi:beta-N-acetylhexosaminidase
MAQSLDVQIGQMLLVGFRGLEVAEGDPVARDVRECHLGGVVLFDQEMADGTGRERNVRSPDQVAALTARLQSMAAIPLLAAIDQEGGRVNRLKAAYGFPETLSQEELGLRDDPGFTRRHAAMIATTLKAAGLNVNLAPVVDLDCNPDNPIIKGKKRSFSADPERVAAHALACIEAHRELGVLTCPKHFPGHGSARGDTHLGLVDVTDTWSEAELIPFQRLIAGGACELLMSAHVFNARLDPEHPATLSPAVLTGLLRGRLGFAGVVASDDMEMRAISAHYGLERALDLAILAGVDLLCFGNNLSHDPDIGRKAHGIIRRLVEAGRIPEARITESAARIAKLKQQISPR